MSMSNKRAAEAMSQALGLSVPPIAISFANVAPDGVAAYDAPMSAPTLDGRSGRVPASCVFWVESTDDVFSTIAADHGNCSVGRYVHGFATLDDIVDKDDVSTLLGSGWVAADAVAAIPVVTESAPLIVYGPLTDAGDDTPDVVLIRGNAKQMMLLQDALPELSITGKPQCQIVAIAKENGQIAASLGCALSRERTGIGDDEMTCAIPGSRLGDVVSDLERAVAIDDQVATYAADDSQRFDRG